MMKQILFAFFVGCLITLGGALPTGAPENDRVCIDMNPLHNDSEPQSSGAPYTMVLSQNTYLPGDIIQVEIQGTDGAVFRGFTAQARRVTEEEEPIGTMLPMDDDQSKNVCETFAITHTNNEDKGAVTFEWQAPDVSEGDLEIYFSVVQEFATYWIRERSEPLVAALSRGETLRKY